MGGRIQISVNVCKKGVRVSETGVGELGIYTDLATLLDTIRGCGNDINDERWIRRAVGELAVFNFREGLGMTDPYREFTDLVHDAKRWRETTRTREEENR